jgi:hypothetical protein
VNMLLKARTFSLLPALLLGVLVAPQANATQKITYTLTVPFQYSYPETGAFKPPAKLSQPNVKFVQTDNCNVVVGKKPVVEVKVASGKTVATTAMRAAHKLNSSTWGKDANGENKFLVKGTCTFIGVITNKLPDSNFYQFRVWSGGRLPNVWSFPYTAKQLAAMKGGIKETHFLDDLRTPGVFTPVPEIETPQVKSLGCSAGTLTYAAQSIEDEEQADQGEPVQAVYLMVTNGIYRPTMKDSNSPLVEQLGDRIESHEDYFVKVVGFSNGELISENTPAFVTWRKPGEKNFSTSIKISYMTWAPAEVRKVARDKIFDIQVADDCKTVTITTP